MSLLDNLTQIYYQRGLRNQAAQSLSWFRKKIKQQNVTAASLMAQRTRMTPDAMMGGMFFFHYNPKTKDKLPYYDRFPLTIIINMYADGFLGLNLHYLDYRYRAIFLDKLGEVKGRKSFSMTYQYLNGAARFKEIKPCVKRYLYSHVQSQFLPVYEQEWPVAIFLPVEQFAKADAGSVWSESRSRMK